MLKNDIFRNKSTLFYEAQLTNLDHNNAGLHYLVIANTKNSP